MLYNGALAIGIALGVVNEFVTEGMYVAEVFVAEGFEVDVVFVDTM